MVTRLYFCKNCDHEFETAQHMHQKLLKKCPKCKKNKLVQDLSGGFYGSVKQYNTVGSLAEKQTRELGTYGRQAKEKAILDRDEAMIQERNRKIEESGGKVLKKPKNPPIISDRAKEVIRSGNQDAVDKYIHTGK